MGGWRIDEDADVAHVTPVDDLVGHSRSDECVCGPVVEFVDPDTGVSYEGRLVVHQALDGRE